MLKTDTSNNVGHENEVVRIKETCVPGERAMAILLIIFAVFGYYFAMGMTNDTFYSPDVIPKLTSTVIFFCAAFIYLKTLKKLKSTADAKECVRFLIPKDVVVVIILLVLYSIALPLVHFSAATCSFLIATMLYLQKGTHMIRSILISIIATLVLVGIFRYIFLVILP